MNPVRVGVVGAGTIATVMHLPGLKQMQAMGKVDVVAVCDAIEEKASEAAAKFEVPLHFHELERMLEEVEFDLLVNLTPISDHYKVSLAGLWAGRHVYSQKPIATSVAEATTLIAEARQRGLMLATAPEHPVRPIIRKIGALIAEGAIGRIAFARVPSSHEGPEKHNVPRDSTWFYQPGSSPILDMGVHGLSTITSILGPVRRLACFSGRTSPVRVHTAGAYQGKSIDVNIDDNSLLMLDFGDATFAFLDATYCVEASIGPRLEIFGSEGSIAIVGENPRETKLHLYESAKGAWREVRVDAPPPIRDLGVLNIVEALLGESELILTGERGRHLVEIMAGATEAAASGRTVELTTTI
jgi:predicted dehydrogenase